MDVKSASRTSGADENSADPSLSAFLFQLRDERLRERDDNTPRITQKWISARRFHADVLMFSE
jgi:hypothetical protein